jgi:hypothetical protein
VGYYFKYQFTSPEGIFSIIQEELKSYYDTGAIDSLMFNTYLNKALQKLGRSSYVISDDLLYIEDFQARLPDNFYAVREAWLCTEENMRPYPSANSFYSQSGTATVIQIAPITANENTCTNPMYETEEPCMPEMAQFVYKTNTEMNRTFRRDHLLKPGNISAVHSCSVDYMDNWERYARNTPFSSSYDSFDVRDNKFVVNFRYGVVNFVFYATDYDENQNQLVPDNFRIKEYVEKFIKYKCFETLSNQINDETFNQIQQKMLFYKQEADEAFIMANLEIMKQTPWEKQQRIKQSLSRHNRFELPNHTNRYGWRRN